MTTLSGTGNDDLLSGDAGNDVLVGEAGNDSLTGGEGDDTLEGGAGNDTLDGGTGNDRLTGGANDDIYVLDSANDVVFEANFGGTDTVMAACSYTLANHIENLILTGLGALSGTGNALDNNIVGNAGDDSLYGGAGNDILNGGVGNNRLIGGANDDIYVVNSTGDLVVEAENAGTDAVWASVTYTLTTNVENLILTGLGALSGTGNALDNNIVGNAGNDSLYGGAGNDILDGGTGNDRLTGGANDDIYFVASVYDVVSEAENAGADTVMAAITYTLTNNVENLTLTGSGALTGTCNGLDNNIVGNSGNNRLYGGAGNDTLDGGAGNDILNGNAGYDFLNGGAGDNRLEGGANGDIYVVNSANDVIVEGENGGADTVYASINYSLTNYVESLILTERSALTGTGNALDNTLIGNSGNNVLSGGAGNDRLYGNAGNDTLDGGGDDDTYIVNSRADVVTEVAYEGFDTVRASATYTLTQYVENLTLTGSGALGGTGNGSSNHIIGNNGNNDLYGGVGEDTLDGSIGNDTLYGGAGDDTYVVNSTADVVLDFEDNGTDSIFSSITYSLTRDVENLTLTDSALSGTGNALANRITGNAGNNNLYGSAGNDTLDGGAGNDRLIGEGETDTASYAGAGSGVTVSLALTLSQNTSGAGTDILSGIEDLMGSGFGDRLIGSIGANRIDGGEGNDVITAGAGADTLLGGSGSDTLTGGSGDDTFVFSGSPNVRNNLDSFTDFGSNDWLGLRIEGFGLLSPGGVGRGMPDRFFWRGAASHDVDDRFIYNSTTGALYYDSDGTGAAAAVQIVQLGAGTALSATDMLFF